MWPGQQPPGGEQNPQDQNPYQQPGYPQQNPYQQPGYPQQPPQGQPSQAQPPQGPPQGPPPQQPGYPPAGAPQANPYQQPTQPMQPNAYQQPNPYQQPTVPQYAVPGQPPGAPVPPRTDDKRKTTVIAIVAAIAVVAAAGVTGFLVLQDDDKKTTAGGDAKPSQSASAGSSPSAIENPRDGSAAAQPTIPGWKVVSNPKYGTLFDVPPDWEVSKVGAISAFDDVKKGDGSPAVVMTSPAYFKSEWCTDDTNKDGRQESTTLSATGTKGAQGAKDTADAAYNAAGSWAWAAYAQTEPKGTVKASTAVPYTSKSGLTGHVSTATALNVKKTGKCKTDGKSIAFAFKNDKGDYASWVLYGAKGVSDELPDATIQKILSTVRLAEPAS
ncbi:hypothetical protein ACIRNI_24825 [Streptomyces sp. NPDC093546]|uniref:hypothetical protein n=1 Tax=Streptomyces sp. NPDC093546 TaxID=3366040 RepID=UPI003809BBD0